MLYTPATQPDRVTKALTMEEGPDMVVADLEDAVGPEDKASARDTIQETLTDLDAEEADAERCIRVNGIDSQWFMEDVEAAVQAEPDTIVVPKVESPGQLRTVDGRLTTAEAEHEVEEGSIEVIAQLETAHGVAAAEDIGEAAGTVERVTGLVFGAEDFAATVGARRSASNREVLYARSRVVLAAALGEVQAIDQVHIAYEELEALREDAEEGRDLGYVGKQIVHPGQIEPVHDVFTPDEEAIAEAREVLDAVEAADIEEGGVISHEGRMIDPPLIQQSRRIVDLADALE
jgi:citrate lyase subunit beta/citryl-CoA lyase